MHEREKLQAIKEAWYELELSLRQSLANVYLKKERKEVKRIRKLLESLFHDSNFTKFLQRLHREHEIKEAEIAEDVFQKKHLFKENPAQWYSEARSALIPLLKRLSAEIKSFEAFQKNRHEKVVFPNVPPHSKPTAQGATPLSQRHFKIAIVGGGFCGMSAAYFLLLSGKYRGNDIVIIDKKFVGNGASFVSAGFLTVATEHDCAELFKLLGRETALKYWNAAEIGLQLVKGAVEHLRASNELELNGSLYLGHSKDELERIKGEARMLTSVGYPSKFVSKEYLAKYFGIRGFEGAVYSELGGYFIHGHKFLGFLKQFLAQSGVFMMEGTEIVDVKSEGNILTTRESKLISADRIILATNYAVAKFRLLSFLRKKLYPLETHLALTEPLPASFLKKNNWLRTTFMWDTTYTYTYFKVLRDGRMLIGGGKDIYLKSHLHEIQSEKEFIQHFYKYLVGHFPELRGIRFEHQWSGIVAESVDCFPFIGRVPNTQIYVAVTDYIVHAFLSGKIISDLITKGNSEYAELFALERKVKRQ